MTPLGGVDLGATNLRAAVAEPTGDGDASPPSPLAVEHRRTPSTDGAAVARAAAAALEAAASAAGVDPRELRAVGVGTMGPLDREAGLVTRPPNLPGVERIPLRGALADLVGHGRVFVENDAVAGLVGERAATAEPPANHVYLTISTGIGAGVAVDDHVLRGRDGNAAEVGHLVVDPEGRLTCGCGRPGHWEAYCAGAAIPGYALDVADDEDLATTIDLDDPELSAADVFAAAGDDPVADRVVERVTRYNAVGVADLVHAYAPDRIAVGGAVALENPSLVVEPLADAAAEHAMLAVPEIRAAAHGRDAVLLGALALAVRGGLED